jgi:hypothetical protein
MQPAAPQEGWSGPITVRVKDIRNGQDVFVELGAWDTIGILKKRIEAKGLGPAARQRVVFQVRAPALRLQRDAGGTAPRLPLFLSPVRRWCMSWSLLSRGGSSRTRKRWFRPALRQVHSWCCPSRRSRLEPQMARCVLKPLCSVLNGGCGVHR